LDAVITYIYIYTSVLFSLLKQGVVEALSKKSLLKLCEAFEKMAKSKSVKKSAVVKTAKSMKTSMKKGPMKKMQPTKGSMKKGPMKRGPNKRKKATARSVLAQQSNVFRRRFAKAPVEVKTFFERFLKTEKTSRNIDKQQFVDAVINKAGADVIKGIMQRVTEDIVGGEEFNQMQDPEFKESSRAVGASQDAGHDEEGLQAFCGESPKAAQKPCVKLERKQ
jgi:hypothetical protein